MPCIEQCTFEIPACKFLISSNLIIDPVIGMSSKVVRKSIATVHTVVHAKQRNALKLHYAKQKYTPLDLRAKKVTSCACDMLNYLHTTRRGVMVSLPEADETYIP